MFTKQHRLRFLSHRLSKHNLNKLGRKTYLIHLIYSSLEGVLYGVFALNEFVFVKSMLGNPIQLGLLIQIQTIVLLISVFSSDYIKRTVNKKKFLMRIAIFTRVPLLLFFIFPAIPSGYIGGFFQILMLGIMFMYFSSMPLILPLLSIFLKNRYRPENLGKLFGKTNAVCKILSLFSTMVFGFLLDLNHYTFRFVYPAMGVLGILSIYILSQIKYTENLEYSSRSIFQSIQSSLQKMVSILRTNRPFLSFEMAFMLYGFTYLTAFSIIPILYVKELKMNYTEMAIYKNIPIIITILTSSRLGKLLGKIDPRKFSIYTYLIFGLSLVFFMLSVFFKQYFEIQGIRFYSLLLIASVLLGFFSSAMDNLWNVGSNYFSDANEVVNYQATHVSLTGLRGSIAPSVGIMIFGMMGYTGVFAFGILCLIIAIFVLHYSMGKYKIF